MDQEDIRPSPARHIHFCPMAERNPSTIRLRRLRSQDPGPQSTQPTEANAPPDSDEIDFAQPSPASTRGRPRSSTIPPRSTHEGPPLTRLPSLPEATPISPILENDDSVDSDRALRPQAGTVQQPATADRRTLRSRSSAVLRGMNFGRPSHRHGQQPQGEAEGECYDPRIVDMLDVIDPEVSTLSSITNVQNSLFVPSLGRYINRRPTYDLDSLPEPLKRTKTASTRGTPDETGSVKDDAQSTAPGLNRQGSLMFDVGERYAVLPNDTTVEGWSKEDVALLNDYVRHMLHSRRSKIKRSFKAFGKYIRKPLGFFVTLYATLITLFGLAWVLFLIGWIYVGERQPYATNVIDYVLVALFGVVGDGLIPFRAMDTYHMIFIARYHRLTWKLRKKMALPKLEDHNDLPTALPACDQARPCDADLEQGMEMPTPQDGGTHHAQHERSVLTPKQQATLVHHQNKYAKSHTFYKPHETETHHAFPLRLLIAIQVLLDLHSCLQVSLGAVTYGIQPDNRPMALTATILSCSITVNVTAGILISIGDHRTRKKDVLDRMFRQELTETAIKKVKKRQEERASMEKERPGKLEGKKEGKDKEHAIEEETEEDAEELVTGRRVDDDKEKL